jgi:hypothetical protein
MLSAGASWGIAWKIQASKITQMELDNANDRISRQRAARAAIENTVTQRDIAQRESQDRAISARTNAAAANAASNKLRDESTIALRTASKDLATCTISAITFSGLLNNCSERYQGLGESCERHVSDIKTMITSWPN